MTHFARRRTPTLSNRSPEYLRWSKKYVQYILLVSQFFPQITVALRRKFNHPHNLISHFWMPLETLAYCSSSIVKLQAKKIFRNSSLACICGKLSTFFQNVEHKSIPSTCTMAHLLGVFFVLLCLNEVSCSSFLGKIRKTLSFCLYCKFMHVFGHSVI